MNEKRRSILITVLFFVLIYGFAAICIAKPADAFSESERRELASFPSFSWEALKDGTFIEDFETYATERFPYRDAFRGVKAFVSTRILGKQDNNGVFVADGHISKLDAPLNPPMLEHAADRFSYLYQSFLKDSGAKVYFSVIPDKNFILAPQNGYPSLDYPAFIRAMQEKTDYMTYIDVCDLLDLEDYYTTDTHWRQEKICDIAVRIGDAMGTDVRSTYEEIPLDKKFYGVYKGQLALPFAPDTLVYLENDTLRNCTVTYYDTGAPKAGALYNMKKAEGKDPYEMFLSGTTPLVTIENPSARTKKHLVLFRDSFGSSLAPLLAEGYQKITLVDIRYMQSAFVGNLVDFTDCDVLFMYSTTLLNSSMSLK